MTDYERQMVLKSTREAVEEEREACAKIADAVSAELARNLLPYESQAGLRIAKAIRKRGAQ